jgi:amino acid transporter
MTLLLLVNVFCAGFSSMTVTSRIGFAMARDKAFPYSHVLHRVHPTTKAPHTVIALTFVIDVLLCLLPLVSQTAFEAITSISAIGYQISYAIPILLRLTVSTFQQSDAFSLGRLSTPLGWLAVLWLLLTSCFFVMPLKF